MTEPTFFELREDDGTISLLDMEAFNDDVKRLAAGLIVLDMKHPASTELMRIHSVTKSSAYVREVSRRAAYVLMDYLFEDAGTFAMPIALKNLNTFLLAYRTVRPEPPDAASTRS